MPDRAIVNCERFRKFRRGHAARATGGFDMSAATPSEPAHADRGRSRRVWYRLACYACLPYALVSGMFAFLQRTLIYIPDREPASARDAGFLNGEVREISRVTHDGLTVHGWLVRADDALESSPEAAVDDSRPLVLYFPGNAGHRGYRQKEIRQLTSLGCQVLYFDYRGYAENPGQPTEADLARDARGAWDYAVDTLGARPEQIIIWGESLGGGVATRLAHDLCTSGANPAGLILRCTFTSLVDAGVHHYPWLPVRWILVDRYPSIERIPHVTCPLLVIHGRQDEIVPFEHGAQLFAAAPQASQNGVAKQFLQLPLAGHNDMMYVAADDIRAALAEFLGNIETAVH
jgi:fermentation-respiration switch protein FrsA (DUF1100 family)